MLDAVCVTLIKSKNKSFTCKHVRAGFEDPRINAFQFQRCTVVTNVEKTTKKNKLLAKQSEMKLSVPSKLHTG